MPFLSHADLRPVKWHLYLALTGLCLGVLMGFLQAMERGGSNLYDEVPVIQTYYQGLTLHGVALALIFTFSFANAFMPLLTMRGLGRPDAQPGPGAARRCICGWGGVALAAWAILANKADGAVHLLPAAGRARRRSTSAPCSWSSRPGSPC